MKDVDKNDTTKSIEKKIFTITKKRIQGGNANFGIFFPSVKLSGLVSY